MAGESDLIQSIIILAIIGFILYKIFVGKKPKQPSRVQNRQNRQVQASQTSNTQQSTQSESLMKNAQRQMSRGNYDEASNLYLRAGQVFTAAKMKLFKGPEAAAEALNLVRVNAPEKFDIILDNLVNEFYYRVKKPAISVALLREVGYYERAEALAVASGIAMPQMHQQAPVTHAPASTVTLEEQKVEVPAKPVAKEVKPPVKEVAKPIVTTPAKEIPNTLMMAQSDTDQNCLVCRRPIKAGDSFIYCLNCGKPGHYKHLGEMMKVTGKCPSCKTKLRNSMYTFD
ncbi:MAG: E3 ubiquitin protein ligase [Candidatus Heimdallarchaeota archaeon]|nr:E3 ubiquitin protein ligase [Candidatus Heimdallarchaeota archaeon]